MVFNIRLAITNTIYCDRTTQIQYSHGVALSNLFTLHIFVIVFLFLFLFCFSFLLHEIKQQNIYLSWSRFSFVFFLFCFSFAADFLSHKEKATWDLVILCCLLYFLVNFSFCDSQVSSTEIFSFFCLNWIGIKETPKQITVEINESEKFLYVKIVSWLTGMRMEIFSLQKWLYCR